MIISNDIIKVSIFHVKIGIVYDLKSKYFEICFEQIRIEGFEGVNKWFDTEIAEWKFQL